MKIGNYNRPPNRQLQYKDKIMECKKEQTKPRSMHKVLADIEFWVTNEFAAKDMQAFLTDISQLKSQLDSVANAVYQRGDYKAAYSVLNPAASYYKKD